MQSLFDVSDLCVSNDSVHRNVENSPNQKSSSLAGNQLIKTCIDDAAEKKPEETCKMHRNNRYRKHNADKTCTEVSVYIQFVKVCGRE